MLRKIDTVSFKLKLANVALGFRSVVRRQFKGSNMFNWAKTVIVSFLLSLVSIAEAAPEDIGNFRINPMAAMMGGLTITTDFKIAEQWTIGPELSLTSFKLTSNAGPSEDTSIQTYSIGARANWFQNKVFNDGFYVGPFVTYASAKARLDDVNGSVSNRESTLFGGAIGGYAWFWKSFNVMVGGGLTIPFGTSKVEVENSRGARTDAYINGSGVALLELSLGWAF